MDTPAFEITQEHLKLIAEIDEFKGTWQALGTLSPDQLSAMKRVATIESIGSSTRIEGARLSDSEVEALLAGIDITSLGSRDEEEVAGYAACMEMVFESHGHIAADENHIRQLHGIMLQYSAKDSRHRGKYKKLPNHVEAFDRNGKSLGIIFATATPFETPGKMQELAAWLQATGEPRETHPLLVIAVFIVHFLAIHPFQDGNGRLSRILTTLLLLREGYAYVPYNSLERIIEENKEQYYLALRQAQKTMRSDNSTLNSWIIFFLRSLHRQVVDLKNKIHREQLLPDILPLSQEILQIARQRGKLTVREVVQVTGANRNTVKSHIRQLVKRGMLEQAGIGKGTWYRTLS